jgi:hypothetical protein
MAKKVRRVRRSKGEGSTTESSPALPTRPVLTPEEEFHSEYAYVLRDLQRVFILAIAMFVLLIALNLLIA